MITIVELVLIGFVCFIDLKANDILTIVWTNAAALIAITLLYRFKRKGEDEDE